MSMPDVRGGHASLAVTAIVALAMLLAALVIVFLSSRGPSQDRIVMIGQPHDKQTGPAYHTQIGTPERLDRTVRTTTTQPPVISQD